MTYKEIKTFLQSFKELKGLTIYQAKKSGGMIDFTACNEEDDEGACYYGYYDDADGVILDFAGFIDDLQ